MDYDELQAELELILKKMDEDLFKIGADIDECVDETTTAGKAVHEAFAKLQATYQALTKNVEKLSDADIVEEEEEEAEEEDEEEA